MEEVERDLRHLYGLEAIQTYTIGDEMRLINFSGIQHMGNTAVETVDLRGLDRCLKCATRKGKIADIQWALVKTATSGKESILVSLGGSVGNKLPSLGEVALHREPREDPPHLVKPRDPFELAISNSLWEQGIANTTTSSEY